MTTDLFTMKDNKKALAKICWSLVMIIVVGLAILLLLHGSTIVQDGWCNLMGGCFG